MLAGLICKIAGHDHLSDSEITDLLAQSGSIDESPSFVSRAYRAGLDDAGFSAVETADLVDFCAYAANTIRYIHQSTESNPELLRALKYRLRRAAISETVGALNLGRAHKIRRQFGPDAKVMKKVRSFSGSCSLCSSLHKNSYGLPRVFALSDLPLRSPRGLAIGPAHPGCLCELALADDYLLRNTQGEISTTGLGAPNLLGGLPITIQPPSTDARMREALEIIAEGAPGPQEVNTVAHPIKDWLDEMPTMDVVHHVHDTDLPNLANDLDEDAMRRKREWLFGTIREDIREAANADPMKRIDLDLKIE